MFKNVKNHLAIFIFNFAFLLFYVLSRNIYLRSFSLLSSRRPEEGMEMQTLGAVASHSDNDSITSLEYHKPNTSTIGI